MSTYILKRDHKQRSLNVIIAVMGKINSETFFGLTEPVPAEEVGYARVSDKDDQDPDFQIALLRKRGIPDANIFVDYQSGRTMDRPRLELALKLMAGRPGWTLVVYKLDRLGRNTAGLVELMHKFEKNQWNLVSLTEQLDTRSAMGRMVFTLMAAFAQLESDLISERTRAGIARRKEKGLQVGRMPKLTLEQMEGIEKALLRDATKTIKAIADDYNVSPSLIQKWFPGWRTKTDDEREAHRKDFPLVGR